MFEYTTEVLEGTTVVIEGTTVVLGGTTVDLEGTTVDLEGLLSLTAPDSRDCESWSRRPGPAVFLLIVPSLWA